MRGKKAKELRRYAKRLAQTAVTPPAGTYLRNTQTGQLVTTGARKLYQSIKKAYREFGR